PQFHDLNGYYEEAGVVRIWEEDGAKAIDVRFTLRSALVMPDKRPYEIHDFTCEVQLDVHGDAELAQGTSTEEKHEPTIVPTTDKGAEWLQVTCILERRVKTSPVHVFGQPPRDQG